jgi:hypothetical protein
MAQSHALNQRFQLFLPPPEDPAAIHSALTQVIEALAADMIEPSRARALISGLRLCLQSLKKKDSWHDSAFHCDEPVDYDNFEAEYGLPKDIDVTMSPEAAFPPISELSSRASAASEGSAVSLSSRAEPAVAGGAEEPALSLSKGPAFLPDPDIAAEAQHIIDVSRGLPSTPDDFLRFGSCVTPLDAELMEVTRTHGFDAAQKIQEQFERNEHRRVHRRQSSADRERYALISMQRNLQSAIERRAARLASETRQEVGCPTPPSFGGVGPSTPPPKKPAASETQTQSNARANDELTHTGSIG